MNQTGKTTSHLAPYFNPKTGLREVTCGGPDVTVGRKARKARARALTLARQKGVPA